MVSRRDRPEALRTESGICGSTNAETDATLLPLSDDVALVLGVEFLAKWLPNGRTKYCFIPII